MSFWPTLLHIKWPPKTFWAKWQQLFPFTAGATRTEVPPSSLIAPRQQVANLEQQLRSGDVPRVSWQRPLPLSALIVTQSQKIADKLPKLKFDGLKMQSCNKHWHDKCHGSFYNQIQLYNVVCKFFKTLRAFRDPFMSYLGHIFIPISLRSQVGNCLLTSDACILNDTILALVPPCNETDTGCSGFNCQIMGAVCSNNSI